MIHDLAIVDGDAAEAAQLALRSKRGGVRGVLQVEELDRQLQRTTRESKRGAHEEAHEAVHPRLDLHGAAPERALEPAPRALVAEAVGIVRVILQRRKLSAVFDDEHRAAPGGVHEASRQHVLRGARDRPMQGGPRDWHGGHVESHGVAPRLGDARVDLLGCELHGDQVEDDVDFQVLLAEEAMEEGLRVVAPCAEVAPTDQDAT
mmetsp:Transcript_50122/g.144399  ORF Transcript_50122/g.144399 Transcript_50122/m.144399 type:complete len:205 (-) Transcript_50122:485-1099(-)